MRVSFDLDEVLFVDPRRYEIEPVPNRLHGKLFRERLRKGTVRLIKELQRRGYEVWIYTSSHRSERYLNLLLGAYGIHFKNISGRRETVRASLIDIMTVKHLSPDQMHVNPDDDFANPKVGPNEEIVNHYIEEAS